MNKNEIILKLLEDALDIQFEGEYITVAELKTIEKNGIEATTDLNTVIISESLVNKIKPSHLSPYVKSSGLGFYKTYETKPAFWIYLSNASGLKKAEPLVVSWCSGNHTTFNIDQSFLNTFYLSPRILSDEILWDDLKRPTYAVVKNKPLSEYNFPINSPAYVKVLKDYLETYLSLRKKVAVQVFTLKKKIPLTEDILFLIKKKNHFIEEQEQFEIRIRKINDDIVDIEINGYKILFEENKQSSIKQKEYPMGHYWKGIEGLVTQWRARHEMPSVFVYVSDEVLSRYEADEDYDVYPKSGSVSYRNQWSVSYCKRVGINAIKIELKKLYEGNTFEIIDYWNKFSIHPSEVVPGENIALKAERLSKQFFLFGRLLANIFNQLFKVGCTAIDIISLNETQIEYTGWSEFFQYKEIAHRVDLKFFSKDQFLSRCKKLQILLLENLNEKTIRKVVNELGFPRADTEKFRSLKLLELIVKYLYVARKAGLDPASDKNPIIERTKELIDFPALSKLFAINDIRQIDAHKENNVKIKLYAALKQFDIEPNSITNNYADTCFVIYDGLIDMFDELNFFLSC